MIRRAWIGYDEEKAIIVDVMEYADDDFDRISGATYVELLPPLHPDAIKLERDSNNDTITVVRDDDAWAKLEPKLIRNLRMERNKRLTECDWVTTRAFTTDTPVPDEWKTYMQALRDIPSTTGDPENPIWPEAPELKIVKNATPTHIETLEADLSDTKADLSETKADLQTTRTELADLKERLNTHTHPLEEHTHPLEPHTHPLEEHTHPLEPHTHPLEEHTHPEIAIEKAKTHELQQRLTLIEHSHAALVARLVALENM